MKRWLQDLRAALSGEEHDYTKGPIGRALFLLSVPIVLEMSMEALFAIFDAFYVSLLDNEEYLATIGLTETSLFVLESLALGIGMAATAMVARRIGEKDKKGAEDAAFQALIIAVIFSIIIGLLGYFFTEDWLRLLGGSEKLIEEGAVYARIMFTCNIVLMLLFTINAIFRGAGDATIAMWTLVLSNGINIILDPCLIFGWGPFPELGFKGAAIATCIGRGIGVLFLVYHLCYGRRIIKLGIDNVRLIPSILKRLLYVTGGSAGQHLVTSSSWIVMIAIIAAFGSKVLAAYTIALRVIVFTILPAWGIAMAAATLVGQNLGAKQPERAEKTVWKAAIYNMMILAIISIIAIIWAHPIIGIFTEDPEVMKYGVMGLRVIFAGYILYAYEMVIGQSFNGAGDTYTPTILNAICFWLIQIPLAYFLGHHLGMASTGVFIAIAISSCILAVLAIIVFRRGHWKNVEI